ncbi:bifunctional DedA family/phosphatase PAP2 family protein, partial [Tabrizicola sp.]|uniref:bifunctional DedA family/phosphatase PAP2 family protein n=1 Tax=Tabrizicola sp. TaxID=2005166 RepID=UPI0025EF5085
AFGEAMLFIGLFVPSIPIMIGAGALVGLGKLGLFPVLIASALGAIAGDALSYWIGRRGKRHLTSVWPLATHPDLLVTGESFFARYGSLSIFLARFVPVVKAVLPTVAGMAGMAPLRFFVVNVLSALMWSAAHLFPSMLLGRGLGVAATANPKVIELFLGVLVLAILGWITARLLARRAVPKLADLSQRAASRLAVSDRPWRRWVARHLAQASSPSSILAEAMLAVAAGAGLVILAAMIVLDPELARADAAMSGWLRANQSDLATRIFLGFTMLADWRVLFPVAAVILGYVAVLRDWRLMAVLATAFASTLAFVPAMKLLIQRARPTSLYSGAEAFSFPSGHATHATVILGVAALLVASTLGTRLRGLVYGAVAALVMIIAVSRVYLGAHWPTDVIAGMLFGAVVLLAVAVLTREARQRMPRRGLSVVILLTLGSVFGVHIARDYGTTATFNSASPPLTTISRNEWRAGYPAMPAARTLLNGEPGEPMQVQTDLPLPDLVTSLQTTGWMPSDRSWIAEVADSALPTRAALDTLAPWPMTDLGQRPLATLTRAGTGTPASRTVLRIWDSGVRLAGPDARPVLVLSATVESLDPMMAGFEMLESAALDRLDPALPPFPGTTVTAVAGGPDILAAE